MNYTKGQYVIYSGTEICSIGEIVKRNFDGEGEKDYITINPLELNTTFYVPWDKADYALKPLMPKEKLLELIERMKTETAQSRGNTDSRNINFRDALKEGKHEVILSVMSEIYMEKLNRAESGKQLYKMDKRNFELAKKLIDSEISILFGIESSEVEAFIRSKVK